MLSEILVYKIEISRRKKFLKLFHKIEKESYILTYRISEDRFWYYFFEGKKIRNDQLMKQSLENSVRTMNSIKNRFKELNSFMKDQDIVKIETYELNKSNYELYKKLKQYSDIKERYYQNKGYFD